MANQVINTIKPLLIEGIKKEINEHKNDFDAVEQGIDKVIDDVEKNIKPIADPIVTGIKMIPIGDPKSKLDDLNTEIDEKIDGIDLSTELQKIEGLPEGIKERVASLPEKVKTKLKASIKKIITGEDKPQADASSTDASASVASDESGSSTSGASTNASGESGASTSAIQDSSDSTGSSASSSTGDSIDESPDSSTETDTKSLFKSISEKDKNITREEVIKKLLDDKIFDNPPHIMDFVEKNFINHIQNPAGLNQQPSVGAVESEQPGAVEAVKAVESEQPGAVEAVKAVEQPGAVEAVKAVESNTSEIGKTSNSNMPPTPPSTDNTSSSNNPNMPPTPPSTDNTSSSNNPNTPPEPPPESKGGASKKQRRKTKKNIRRRLNKSTRFGRAF